MRDIKLITFDLDDTFWDIGPPIIKAEKETRHWLNEKVPGINWGCLLYTSPSPRDKRQSRMPSSA